MRSWSIPLGRLAGIPVYVHATFFLLLGWIGLTHWMGSRSLPAVVDGVLFILAIFGCVVLHELGHALAARRYGIATRDITLLPIGGVARLERMPERPAQELWVALAGPAVNVLIAAMLLAWLWLTRSFEPLGSLGLLDGPFAERLMVANLLLVVFNMLPAFPMDGGRVVRALLAMRLDYVRATNIAASLGQGAALFLGFLGLFTNPFLLLIALFVWIGATQESGAVRTRSALEGIPVSSAMLTDYRVLEESEPLHRAVDLVLAGSQRDFPVIARGRIVGVLTQARMLGLLAEAGPDAPVGQAIERGFSTAEAAEMLDAAVERMQSSGCPLTPVLDEGQMVGVLTLDNVVELLSIRQALSGDRRPGGPGGGLLALAPESTPTRG